jgi:hypothetical protein
MLAILAFHLAPASVLAPFQHLEILGAVIFNDLPDGLTGIIIVGCRGGEPTKDRPGGNPERRRFLSDKAAVDLQETE